MSSHERRRNFKEAGSISTPSARKVVDPDTVEKRSGSYTTPPARQAPKPQTDQSSESPSG